MIKFLLLLFLPLILFASFELEELYYIEGKDIDLSIITKDKKNSFIIASIDEGRTQKMIKAKDIIDLLSKYGYKDFTSKSNYITFIQKSHLDISVIKEALIEHFKQNYEHINIEELTVVPRGYLKEMPKDFEVGIDKESYLSKNGTIFIETPQKKKYFFDYDIKAYIVIYLSKDKIKKGANISISNTVKKTILLQRLKDTPILDINDIELEANRQIAKESILTLRDVSPLKVVKRGAMISVTYDKESMAITFSAKALQDGKVNDIIKVQNNNKKIIKVRVIGENMAVAE